MAEVHGSSADQKPKRLEPWLAWSDMARAVIAWWARGTSLCPDSAPGKPTFSALSHLVSCRVDVRCQFVLGSLFSHENSLFLCRQGRRMESSLATYRITGKKSMISR